MSVELFIQGDRLVSADYHLTLGREWFRRGRPELLPTPLVYAAFELRMGLERYLFELWYTLQDSEPDPVAVRGQTAWDTVKKMRDYGVVVGNETREIRWTLLQRALEFNSILAEHVMREIPGEGRRLFVPDIDYILDLRSRLSVHCHAPTYDEFNQGDGSHLRDGYRLIEEVLAYVVEAISNNVSGGVPLRSLPPEVASLRKRYLLSEIDRDGVSRTLELMDGVLRQRHAGR